MYIADWGFVKALKTYDSTLNVRWEDRVKRWNIIRKTPNPTNLYDVDMVIMTVENDDRSYRPLDQRTLFHLRKMDTHTRGHDTILDEIEEEYTELEKSHEKERYDEIYDILQDTTPKSGYEDPNVGAINVPKEDISKDLYNKIESAERFEPESTMR